MTDNKNLGKTQNAEQRSTPQTFTGLKSFINLNSTPGTVLGLHKENLELLSLGQKNAVARTALDKIIKLWDNTNLMNIGFVRGVIGNNNKQLQNYFNAIEKLNNNPTFKQMEKLREKTRLSFGELSRHWINNNNFLAENAITKFLNENAKCLNFRLKASELFFAIFESRHDAKNIFNNRLKNDVYAEWDKFSRLGTSSVSLSQQTVALEAINLLFASDKIAFAAITIDMIKSLDIESGQQVLEAIEQEIVSGRKTSEWPEWIKWVLLFIFSQIFQPSFEAVRDDMILEYLKAQCFTKYFCENKNEQAAILSSNRTNEISYSDLNRFRLVKKDNARLRKLPSMNADIIEELPLNQPVIVINRDNRKWLLVRTQVNGEEIEGWINRVYTKVIIK